MIVRYVIIGVVVIIAVVLVFKLLVKNIFKVLALGVIIIGLALYGFFILGSDENDIKFIEILSKYSIRDLEDVYCKDNVSKTDSLKCVCIIKPISNDLHNRFSESELNNLEKKRLKFAKEIFVSFRNKKTEIKTKLKENNSLHLFDEFKRDLIHKNLNTSEKNTDNAD